MPQPVHYNKSIGFDFRPEMVLQRSKLAAHIALISGQWNEIEARTATMAAALLGSEAKTVITVFLALQNDGAKKATLDTFCSLKLSPDDLKTFQVIQKNIGHRYTDRNRAVHGAWGISNKYPDCLLWGDIREIVLFHVMMKEIASPVDRHNLIIQQQQRLMVYSEADFINIERRIKTAYDGLCAFSKPIIERGFGPYTKVDWLPTPPPPESTGRPDPTDY
jgi:hypothetical protein